MPQQIQPYKILTAKASALDLNALATKGEDYDKKDM